MMQIIEQIENNLKDLGIDLFNLYPYSKKGYYRLDLFSSELVQLDKFNKYYQIESITRNKTYISLIIRKNKGA